MEEKTEGFSDTNMLCGKASQAYAGGPVGTPRVWLRGAARCKSEMSFRLCCLGRGIGWAVACNSFLSRSTIRKSSSCGKFKLSSFLTIPQMYGIGASSTSIRRVGTTGIWTPDHSSGQSRANRALLACLSIDVCVDTKIMRDSESMYSINTTILGTVRHRKSGYRSIVRLPSSSFRASTLAYNRSSRITTST